MTPGGRVQAAVGLLDAIIAAARDQGAAADTLNARYFAERRYTGSKDRRAVRDLVYATIRLLGERPESGRQAIVALARADPAVAAMIDGSPHAPPPRSEEHTSELQSLMRISYAVFCLKKKKNKQQRKQYTKICT